MTTATENFLSIGNDHLFKRTLTLQGAGAYPDDSILPADPILEGLAFDLRVRLNRGEELVRVTGFLDSVSPATATPLTLTLDPGDPLLRSQRIVAGSGPTTGLVGARIFARFVFDRPGTLEASEVEREFYLASLPDHAIQVRETASATFVSVNKARPSLPSAPLVPPQAEVRFFSEWADEFEIFHYGGAKFVSVWSRDDPGSEGGFENTWVIRENQVPIGDLRRLLLVRPIVTVESTHLLRFRFRAERDSTDYVDVDVDVRTPATCIPFNTRGPEFPDWVPGT